MKTFTRKNNRGDVLLKSSYEAKFDNSDGYNRALVVVLLILDGPNSSSLSSGFDSKTGKTERC